MKSSLAIAATAMMLAACTPAADPMVATCTSMTKDEGFVTDMLAKASVDVPTLCGCYAKMLAALPEDRQTPIRAGLIAMVDLKTSTSSDMENAYGQFASNPALLEGKPFTMEDLSDSGELVEDTIEALADGGACPAT